MTGPEHFQRAEQLLAAVRDIVANDAEAALKDVPSAVASMIALAQAHATLALAAATIRPSDPTWVQTLYGPKMRGRVNAVD
jgi:hypothetical protein